MEMMVVANAEPKQQCLTIEVPIGIHTLVTMLQNKRMDACQCRPPESVEQRFKSNSYQGVSPYLCSLLGQQATNNKGHSFLQHFPMAVLQGPITSAFPGLIPALMDEISTCFRRLFHEGVQVKGRTWNAACIGHKEGPEVVHHPVWVDTLIRTPRKDTALGMLPLMHGWCAGRGVGRLR